MTLYQRVDLSTEALELHRDEDDYRGLHGVLEGRATLGAVGRAQGRRVRLLDNLSVGGLLCSHHGYWQKSLSTIATYWCQMKCGGCS